jgi:hypothetical protein
VANTVDGDDRGEATELLQRANLLLPGVYAWASTVLYPATLRGAGIAPKIAAGTALASLVLGAFVSPRNPDTGRNLGLHGFVGLSAMTWLLLGGLVRVDRLEPMKAALGAIGWVLFAFGWGALRKPASVPEDDPHVLPGEPLRPRGRLPIGAVAVLGAAVTCAAPPLLFAWRVTRADHALFAHAVAILCAIGLVTTGAEIAVRRGRWRPLEPPLRRLSQATIPLTALGIVVLAGIIEFLAN